MEAEWAAVAQRLQLDALQRALRTLESHVAALESESARQSAELSRLEEMIEQLQADAGLERPRAEGAPPPILRSTFSLRPGKRGSINGRLVRQATLCRPR